MTWAEPGWGLWLLVVAGLAVVTALARRRHLHRLQEAFGDGEVLERVLPRATRLRRRVRDALALVGLGLLVVALAEPRFGKTLREVKAEGVDLVLAVDLSRSMDAADVDPSRLERARREILDLVELLAGDRVALVTFAAGAYPRMPLTLDYRALRLVVRELDTRTLQAQGSALGPAITESVKLLANQPGEAGRAVLFLTDGEAHDHDAALAAAREAADAGVAVYGLVIGNTASRIPNGDGTWLVDPATGEHVLTTPSVETLTEIARITGGAVVRSVPGNEDVRALYRDEIREHLRAAVGRTTRRESWNSAFQWPLGLGLLALLGAAWLGDGRRSALALAALLAVVPLPAHAQSVHDGDAAYRAGRYDEAVRIFTDLSLQDPDDPDLFGRLGAARYRAGDYAGAARAFERQALLDGSPDARFNAGNAYLQSGRLEQALQRYEEVLAEAPEHPGAQRNRALVQAEIERRRQMQPEALPPSGEGEDQPQPQDAQDGAPQGGGAPQDGGGSEEPRPGRAQQDGEPQPGPQNPGSSQGEPQSGQPGEQGGSDGGLRQDEGERTDDGQVSLSDVQQGDQQDGQPAPGRPQDPSPGSGITPEQAARTLDGVEEGSPRVYLPGQRSEKPW